MNDHKRMTPKISLDLLDAMKVRPHSYRDLMVLSGLERSTVARFIKSTRDDKIVHVGSWGDDPRGYFTIPQFAFGPGPDIERPLAKTAAERMAGTRARRVQA